MGRFYKTSKPEYLDFVYKQPNNLLLKTVEKAEQSIDKNLASVADLYGRLKSEALKPDTKRRDEIIDSYKQEIDALSSAIFQDPLSYRGYVPDIKTLSDDIAGNLQRGELAAMSSNVKSRQTYSDKLDAQIKAKEITRSQANWLLNKYDNDFKNKEGTLYAGPQQYQQYSSGFFAPDINLYKKIDERGAGWKASSVEKEGWNWYYDKNNDRYIVTDKVSGKEVSKEKLKESFLNYVGRDPEIQQYYSTRIKEGYFGTPQQGLARMTDDLAAAVAYGIDKFGYSDIVKSRTIGADPYGNTYLSNRLAKQALATTTTLDNVVAQVESIPNPSITSEVDNTLAAQTNKTNDLAKQAFQRIAFSKKGYTQNDQGVWVDKSGKAVTLTPEEQDVLNKEINDASANLSSALDYGYRTGDYSQALEISKDMNPVVADNIKQLAEANTPGLAKIRNNNKVLMDAAKSKVENQLATLGYIGNNPSKNLNWYNTLTPQQKIQVARQQLEDDGLTTYSTKIKMSNDVTDIVGPDKSMLFIEGGKELSKNMDLFTTNSALLPMVVGKDGEVSMGKVSGSLSSVFKGGLFDFGQLTKKQIGTSKKTYYDLAQGGWVTEEKLSSEPIEISDGKFMRITTTEEPVNYSFNKLPGLEGSEMKYLHRVIINEVDEKGKLIKNAPAQEAFIAVSSDDLEIKGTDGTNFNQAIQNSIKGIENMIGQSVEEGVQIANNYKSKQYTTQTNNLAPEMTRYTFYNDGKSTASWSRTGDEIQYYIDNQPINTKGRSDSEIKRALVTKLKKQYTNKK